MSTAGAQNIALKHLQTQILQLLWSRLEVRYLYMYITHVIISGLGTIEK